MSLNQPAGTIVSADSVYFPAADAPWEENPRLAKVIDDAYIQWPHIYMNQRFDRDEPSPLSLQLRLSYHHLDVPEVSVLLNAERAHRDGITGRDIRVAMIDSGFAHTHPYFVERGYNTRTVLAGTATQVDQDGNGHGTGESANLLGMAPDVEFIGIKLDNESDPTGGATILEGFQEALQHDPHVISVSLGFDLRDGNTGRPLTQLPNSLIALEAEIQAAVASGIVVVFSAGNGHITFPGMMPEVISAGGVFVDPNGRMEASDYASAFTSQIYPGRRVPDYSGLVGRASNGAAYIALPIPEGCAIDVAQAMVDGSQPNDGWGVFSGTSAAAPQLAGACALLLQRNPGLTPADVGQALAQSARRVRFGAANPASNPGRPPLRGAAATGAGLIDVHAALQLV
ncbi:MAG: S8 family serine peptidase [Gammaproteobacteria bacterium]|jgi:subtilisin family serine protease|nr:S8 family serine peptidase [Gammaproteobacteria bacterium]